MPNPVVINRDRLWHTFNFGERELTANRHGQLTVKQEHDLQQNLQMTSVTALLIIAFGVGGGMWWVLTVITTHRSNDVESLLTIVLFTAIFSLLAMTTLQHWRAYTEPARSAHIHRARGIAIIRAIGGRAADSSDLKYSLYIGDQRFVLSANERDVLFHGKPYCVYYFPSPQTILSIESISFRPSFRLHHYRPKRIATPRLSASNRRYKWQPQRPWMSTP